MALDFGSCTCQQDKCRIVVNGKKVFLYDPNGEVSKEHSCSFQPSKVYWSEGPYGGWCIVCENGSFNNGEYFDNVGSGVLPFTTYSQKIKQQNAQGRAEYEAKQDRANSIKSDKSYCGSSIGDSILNSLMDSIPGLRCSVECCC